MAASSTKLRCRTLPTPSTSHELSDPSASSDESALLFTSRLTRVWKTWLGSPEVPFSGFGYPLNGVRDPHPWEPLSAPNAPGFRSSELFSIPEIEESVSNSPFRSDTLLRNVIRLVSVFQRLALSGTAVPLAAPRWFRSGRDLLLS
jgi:hypothetical protein